jgi:hypothetical protein
MYFHQIAKIVIIVRCEIFKMSKVNHLTTLLPLTTSQFQVENVNLLLKFMLQELSNDILRANLDYIYYLCFCPKDLRFMFNYNFQSGFHLKVFRIAFLTFFHNCGSVFESQGTLLTYSHFHPLVLITN